MTHSTVRVVGDAVTHVRAHPAMYLNSATPSDSDLASRVAGDAILLGATKTLAVRQGSWWAVAADVDWLSPDPETAADYFRQIIPLPQAGVNSMRSEILLAAFADQLLTWCGTNAPTWIKGQDDQVPTFGSGLGATDWPRVIAFHTVSAQTSERRMATLATT